jgi:hypothetical protein
VHWSVIAKRAAASAVAYSPLNLPTNIRPEQIAEMTEEERTLFGQVSSDR